MKGVYNIDDFLPVKEDLKVVESVNDLLRELGINKTVTSNQINIAKDVILGRIKSGIDKIEGLVKDKQEDRVDEVLSALGLMKTLTTNQLDLVKDAVVQKLKKGLENIEGLVKQVNEKDFSPVIKNDVVVNQEQVIEAVNELKREMTKELTEVQRILLLPKKSVLKFKRDSYDLITEITGTTTVVDK